MKKITIAIKICLLMLISSIPAFAKKTVRQVQEVNFGDMNLKGTIRNPDGAYLVQKRGIKFMPLHDVQKDLDQKIRETPSYID
jgi:hypothetical protein